MTLKRACRIARGLLAGLRNASGAGIVRLVGGVGVVGAVGMAGSAGAQPVSTNFTYQGELRDSGTLADGVYDLRFALFDAAVGGIQWGPTLCADNVVVEHGRFTVSLDFGASFTAVQRYLRIEVRPDTGLGCLNNSGYTTLSPRQTLTATPYALYALSGNPGPTGPQGPQGLQGPPGASPWQLSGTSTFYNDGAVGIGVVPSHLLHVAGPGVGFLSQFSDTYTGGNQSFAIAASTSAVRGTAIFGVNDGATSTVATIQGNTFGVAGIGVAGFSSQASGWAFFGNGRFGTTGTKSFVIDHPLDPANRLLTHYCAEGPEPLNVYSGVVTTDAAGLAVVEMPSYYAAINRDERYLLTVIDDSDEPVFAKVRQKIKDGRFVVWTSKPGVEVSWMVQGVRNDPFVRNYGAPVETDKTADERGTYLRPELYGLPASMSSPNHPGPANPGSATPTR